MSAPTTTPPYPSLVWRNGQSLLAAAVPVALAASVCWWLLFHLDAMDLAVLRGAMVERLGSRGSAPWVAGAVIVLVMALGAATALPVMVMQAQHNRISASAGWRWALRNPRSVLTVAATMVVVWCLPAAVGVVSWRASVGVFRWSVLSAATGVVVGTAVLCSLIGWARRMVGRVVLGGDPGTSRAFRPHEVTAALDESRSAALIAGLSCGMVVLALWTAASPAADSVVAAICVVVCQVLALVFASWLLIGCLAHDVLVVGTWTGLTPALWTEGRQAGSRTGALAGMAAGTLMPLASASLMLANPWGLTTAAVVPAQVTSAVATIGPWDDGLAATLSHADVRVASDSGMTGSSTSAVLRCDDSDCLVEKGPGGTGVLDGHGGLWAGSWADGVLTVTHHELPVAEDDDAGGDSVEIRSSTGWGDALAITADRDGQAVVAGWSSSQTESLLTVSTCRLSGCSTDRLAAPRVSTAQSLQVAAAPDGRTFTALIEQLPPEDPESGELGQRRLVTAVGNGTGELEMIELARWSPDTPLTRPTATVGPDGTLLVTVQVGGSTYAYTCADASCASPVDVVSPLDLRVDSVTLDADGLVQFGGMSRDGATVVSCRDHECSDEEWVVVAPVVDRRPAAGGVTVATVEGRTVVAVIDPEGTVGGSHLVSCRESGCRELAR
ncbi:hypothetical protein [Cellulomonas sp. NPDC089187]|uniref:hypothetical protein n=1 Tax=Cellulomonas sp. NPDC089187 TaxID=3154970 RepID=UPI003443478B